MDTMNFYVELSEDGVEGAKMGDTVLVSLMGGPKQRCVVVGGDEGGLWVQAE